MSNIEQLIERKEKLQEKIKKEKENEYIKFGRWFFNKTNVNSSAEAKKIIHNYNILEEINNNSKSVENSLTNGDQKKENLNTENNNNNNEEELDIYK